MLFESETDANCADGPGLTYVRLDYAEYALGKWHLRAFFQESGNQAGKH